MNHPLYIRRDFSRPTPLLPYAILSVLFCFVGFMAPVVLEFTLVSWLTGVPSMFIGITCMIRYLQWNDKSKEANKFQEDTVANAPDPQK